MQWGKGVFLAGMFLLGGTAQAAVESWYTYWAIGTSSPSYDAGTEYLFDTVESFPGVDRTQHSMDLFGFYFPNSTGDAINGFVVSVAADRLEDSYGYYMQLNQYTYGFSHMNFLGKEIGEGLYLRGDIGMARAMLDTNFMGDATSDWGLGFLLGVGYAIPVSEESRVMLGLSFSSRDIEGEDYTNVAFTVGGLW